MSARSGKCMCGAVTFTAEKVSKTFGVCHCVMCQRWSGGTFMTTTAENVTFAGAENLTRYPSSTWAERGFCRKCGSNLFYRLLQHDVYDMCVGVFDERDGFKFESEIFCDLKPDSYNFVGDHQRLTEKETLEKFKEFSDPAS